MPLVPHPERRYADWRPVAVRRVPAEWIGMGAGVLAGLLMAIVTRHLGWVVWMVAVAIAPWTKGRVVEMRMRELRDDPEGGQFAVSLRLTREVDYGFDEGLVAFEAGWLVYSGRRCTFSVRREDALGLISKPKTYGFLFPGEAGRHAALLTPAEPGRFGGAFRAWAEAAEVPGEPVYPPTRPTDESRLLPGAWGVGGLIVSAVLIAIGLGATKFSGRLDLLWAALLLPATLLYRAEMRKVLDRLARGLPYQRHRLARHLNVRPVRHPNAEYRRLAVKCARERRALGKISTSLSERRNEPRA